MSTQQNAGSLVSTPHSGPLLPYIAGMGNVPADAHPSYVTWADAGEITVTYCGIDVRAILLALDLLRSRNPAYEGMRIHNINAVSMIKHIFQLEFGTDLPSAEMLRGMGAQIRSHDAEAVMNALRDTACPY